MTTLTIHQQLAFDKTDFSDLQEALTYLYEELLEQRLQVAKTDNEFVDF